MLFPIVAPFDGNSVRSEVRRAHEFEQAYCMHTLVRRW
jgi:hypothetical protein